MKYRKTICALLITSVSLLLIGGCKDDSQGTGVPGGPSTVTDIEGNVYRTVLIGTQLWMGENLKTRRYYDGKTIPNVSNNSQWASLSTGATAIHDNSLEKFKLYGRQYNWYAVNTGKLAPIGWHVATDADWTELSDALGGVFIAGGQIKSTSSLWLEPNTGATNSSGFSALPGGYRNQDGYFTSETYDIDWWTATESGSGLYNGIERRVLKSGADLQRITGSNKKRGYYVRCVKD